MGVDRRCGAAAALNARIGELIGNAPQRPWNAGDFFGTRFGQAVAQAR